jgi:rod shape-determining protein MreD
VLLAVLQATLLARLPLLGVVLQPALLVAITWSLLRGLYEGLVVAFIFGLALDLFSVGPTGSMALALMLAIVPLAYLNQTLPENPYVMPVLLTALGMALFLVVYTLIVALAQRGFRANVLTALPLTVLLHTLLGMPIYWSLRWLSRLLYPRQIEV